MKPVEMAPGVYWTGVLDPQLRTFDVIMHADHGTTYNSYLVKGSDGCAVIETNKTRFKDTYLENIASLVDFSEITHIVLNHTEPDHSGCLEALLERAGSAKLVSSKNAVPLIKAILNRDVEVITVGEGDTLDLGGKTLRFIPAPFLHWPDTMFTYLEEDGILFPCDFLGCHYADDRLFNDLVDDFSYSYEYYFHVIFRPFKEHVLKGLDKIQDLPVKMIAPSHGPILRTDVSHFTELYRKWASTPGDRKKPALIVLYASAYGNTARMAESIAEGAREGGMEVSVFDLEVADPISLLDKVESADALAVGSLTIEGDAVKPVWDFLSSLATLKRRGKIAISFGSYGWSGEAPRFIEERLKQLRFKVPEENLRVQMFPTDGDLESCRSLGHKLAELAGQ
jgi:flavorubredoxin